MDETIQDRETLNRDTSQSAVVPPICLRGMSPETQKIFMDPVSPDRPLVNDAKIRRLYLQATSQHWFAPGVINFDQPLEMPDEVRRVWIKFNSIFYTMEQMGLNVIENMTAKAVRRLNSSEAAMYLTSQAADEARHVFLIETYLKKLGKQPEYNRKYHILGQAASMGFNRVENWLFSTLFSENFASAFLRRSKAGLIDPIGAEMCKHLLNDESRHLNFLYVVLPDIMDRLNLFSRTYLKASQFFIMKLTETFARSFDEDATVVGLDRYALVEEVFENMERAYQGLGVDRDWLWFPKIGNSRYRGTVVPVAKPVLTS